MILTHVNVPSQQPQVYRTASITLTVRTAVLQYSSLTFAGVNVQSTGKEILTAASQPCLTRTFQRVARFVSMRYRRSLVYHKLRNDDVVWFR